MKTVTTIWVYLKDQGTNECTLVSIPDLTHPLVPISEVEDTVSVLDSLSKVPGVAVSIGPNVLPPALPLTWGAAVRRGR